MCVMRKATRQESNRNETGSERAVMVVDDHPVVREGLVKLLDGDGWSMCAEARSASEAMQRLDTIHPQVIILDLALPDAHGLEFIKDVRARFTQPRILVYTAFEESIYALRA